MLPQGTKRVFTFPWRSAARVRADIREEFQFHLDMRTAELVAEGRSEAEAREQAQREFGDEAGGAWACARVDTRLERRLHVGTIVDDPLRDMALGVGSDFFRTLGMPLLAGRAFSQADTVGAARVAVVNEAFAKKFNLGPNPVGRRLGRRGASVLDTEIVGLVRDAKYSDVKGEVPAALYEPYRQNTELTGMYFYVRTALPPQGLLMAVPDVVRAIARAYPCAISSRCRSRCASTPSSTAWSASCPWRLRCWPR
jgi:MacB-like periplasmic core domain